VVEYLPTPELDLFVVEFLIGIIFGGIFTNARVGFIHVEYLPTPELDLFMVKFLIGIICVGIFTNTRVEIIHGGNFFYQHQS